MEKKYKTVRIEPEGDMLRIIALKDFSDVKKGEEGGLIEKEENLSHEGDCWIYENAQVFGDAKVCDNARVSKNAYVGGNACVSGNAKISGRACVSDNARIYGQAEIWGGGVHVCGEAEIYENAKITGNITICGQSKICGRVKICSFAKLLNLPDYYIKDYGDYVYLFIKRKLCILFNITAYHSSTISTPGQNYIENIQTIRQLYGKEI